MGVVLTILAISVLVRMVSVVVLAFAVPVLMACRIMLAICIPWLCTIVRGVGLVRVVAFPLIGHLPWPCQDLSSNTAAVLLHKQGVGQVVNNKQTSARHSAA
jgi:hypothetical protein